MEVQAVDRLPLGILADGVAGSHNDTYAESYHRDFFKRWSQGVPHEECSKGTEGHNTASIGGFVTMPPVLISAMFRGSAPGRSSRNRDLIGISRETALSVVKGHLSLTHDSRRLGEAAETYGGLLADVLMGRTSGRRLRASPGTGSSGGTSSPSQGAAARTSEG